MSQATKDKIIDIAERLFGEQGYESTSLRHVIFEAGVNLAAVHYHFGSKEELLDAVVLRGATPLNEERIALLDRYEKESAPNPVPVENVLRAILWPTFRMKERNPQFVKLMGQLHGEGLMPAMVKRHFQPLVERFMACAAPHFTGSASGGTVLARTVHVRRDGAGFTRSSLDPDAGRLCRIG